MTGVQTCALPILLDAAETFKIWTDHENLKYFQEPHKLNGRQARWYLKLQDYDFILRHIPGKTNTKADILSRKDQVDTKEDNKDVQLLKDEMWLRKIVGKIWVFDDKKVVEETDIIKKIKKNGTREKEVLQALQKKDGSAWEEDKVVYMKGRIYVQTTRTSKRKF